jgi:hypothetical protein
VGSLVGSTDLVAPHDIVEVEIPEPIHQLS